MFTNALSREKSPYLLQHQHNPVNWFAWNAEAFAAARSQNKPIFLSIGYSTCYWCHVMEKDSFENNDVATLLNEHFIAIKVDREERPDVDSIYMNAVVSLTGHGGWPMSVFLTPDLKPFYGGTFFRRDQFMILLERIAETWHTHRKEINQTAEQLTSAIQRAFAPEGDSPRDVGIIKAAFEQFSQTFDAEDGGFSPAPKFPPSGAIRLLLRIHRRTGNERALKMAIETLDHMARGGIYDQLGGGFHRYSTDAKWLVPHFEKMLYDNAQLAVAYLEAFQATRNEMFGDVARETLDYVLRDMTGPAGELYSAEDAGDVGREGEFYVWKESELKSLLTGEEFERAKKIYGISAQGNFEHTNVFSLQKDFGWSEKKTPLMESVRKKLLAERSTRKRPHRDDKTLVSWSGLMVTAFATGAQVLNEPSYLRAAKRSASFVREHLWRDEKLLRRYRDGDSRFAAYLDDYAFLIQGVLALYEATAETEWLAFAIELQSALDGGYWDGQRGGYFFAVAEESSLIARQKEFSDNAEPSGNGVAALNLLKLYDLTLDHQYAERAEKLFAALPATFGRFPSAFTSVLIALDYKLDRSKEIAVIGAPDSPEAQEFRRALSIRFIPNKVVAGGHAVKVDDRTAPGIFRGKQLLDDRTTFYVCEEGSCKLPTNDSAKAIELADTPLRYEIP